MRIFALALLLVITAGCKEDPPPGQVDPNPCPDSFPEGEQKLAALDYAGALAAFQTCPSAGGKFGAALARTAMAVESAPVTAAYQAMNQPPIQTRDLLGPDGYFAAYGARWNGSGEVTVDGQAVTLSQVDAFAGGRVSFRGLSADGGRFGVYAQMPPSTSAIGYNCATGTASNPNFVDAFYAPSIAVYCSLPLDFAPADPNCDPDGGRIIASVDGEVVEVTLDAVLITCVDRNDPNSAETVRRVSGTIRATPDQGNIDFTNIDPLLHEPKLLIVDAPSGPTAESLLDGLQPLADELETIGTLLDSAGGTNGHIFTIPPTLFAGVEGVPVTGAESRLLAGLFDAVAALILIAGSYDGPFDFSGLCVPNGCISESDAAARINAAVGGIEAPNGFARAKTLARRGLGRMRDGLGRLTNDAMFARNDITTAGIAQLLTLGEALDNSFAGLVPIPESTPPVSIDLQRIFDTPPDPSLVDSDPIVVTMFGQFAFVEMFFQDLLGPSVQADWAQTQYDGLREIDDAFGHLQDKLNARGLHWD